MANYDISEAFEVIEDELISSMMRNLSHHRIDEISQGMEWEQWQVLQLQALEEYRQRNQKKFPPRFNKLNGQIANALHTSYQSGATSQERQILQAIQNGYKPPVQTFSGQTEITGEFFKTNDRKLNALVNATVSDMSKAEYSILRHTDDQYRQIIFNAQVYANTGAGTYEKAVDMATKDFLKAGINSIQYKNGSRHTIEEYSRMALQTAMKRAYLQGEGEKRKEFGIPTVILKKRTCACPKCLPFVGKVFIDDVWSGGEAYINGENKNKSLNARAYDGVLTGKSPITGIEYPLLSQAISLGLYHPNCRDTHSTYYEGISTPPEDSTYTVEELDEIAETYKAEQQQSYCENQADRYHRLSKYSLDSDNKRMYGARATAWDNKAKQYKKSVSQSNNDKNLVETVENRQKDDIMESELGKFKKRLQADTGMSKEYYAVVKERFSHSSDVSKKAFNKFVPNDSVIDSNYTGTPHYDPFAKKVSMHYGADFCDPRGQGDTFFHEHGHMIDDLAGNLSGNPDFYNSLQKEKSEFVANLIKTNGMKIDEAYRYIESQLSDVRQHSAVSDIFNGLSAGRIKGCGYHDDDYWTTKRVAQEAFAHMFEAQSDKIRYAEMQKYFPKSLKLFEDMLGGAIK